MIVTGTFFPLFFQHLLTGNGKYYTNSVGGVLMTLETDIKSDALAGSPLPASFSNSLESR